jgi:hypothetical protein
VGAGAAVGTAAATGTGLRGGAPLAVGGRGLALGLLAGGAVGASALSSTTLITSPPVERVVTVTAPAPPARPSR